MKSPPGEKVSMIKSKAKRNGKSEIISAMLKSNLEKTSQRLGMATKSATAATAAMRRYIR